MSWCIFKHLLAQQVQHLTHEITLLRQAVADLTVKNLLLEGTLQVYRETYGDSVLKKNAANVSAQPMLPEAGA